MKHGRAACTIPGQFMAVEHLEEGVAQALKVIPGAHSAAQ